MSFLQSKQNSLLQDDKLIKVSDPSSQTLPIPLASSALGVRPAHFIDASAACVEEYIYRLRLRRSRYPYFFLRETEPLKDVTVDPKTSHFRSVTSAAETLPAVARGRHRNPTPITPSMC